MHQARPGAASRRGDTEAQDAQQAGARHDSIRLPIEFLFDEHDRQRVICATLERLVRNAKVRDPRRI